MWLVILLAALLIIGLIGYTIYGHRRHLMTTTGTKIDLKSRPNSALLIIDLQEDFTNATGRHSYDPDLVKKVITAINDLVMFANENGHPVISIRQTFAGWYINLLVRFLNKGRGGPKSGGLDIDARLDGDIDHDIVKSHADAFREPKLEAVLERQKVGNLIIVGLDGNYCVNATVTAALNRGYKVAFSDATTLAIKPSSWQATKSRLMARGAYDQIKNTPAPSEVTSQKSA
ncbi:cysteine hydrolase family protein [Thalassospira sp. MCCC 1A01428]|uniref:cysteine hydrolase family protein n=1 Tax=Thalassospira sp. MCCC 1A01428 TaxID=1470575 RepID=UPI000A1F7F43|nr:cysteine hydrolase [Thalassospira sp. MCCC 1A01428]